MNSNSQEDFAWLFSEEAAPLLQACCDNVNDRVNAVRIAKMLRKSTTPQRAAMIMELTGQRMRARAKFSRSDEMLMTRRGLEQSTSEPIAWFKARRFSGAENVADICCGIGGDFIALARRQDAARTVGVDRDPLCCTMARHNASVYQCPDFDVIQSSFEDFDAGPFDAVHIDPDRRVDGRTVNADTIDPPLETILRKLGNVSAGIKLAPATIIDEQEARQLSGHNIERNWIGDKRECKQQVLWTGRLAQNAGNRTATSIRDGQVEQFSTREGFVDTPASVANGVGKFIFEPHPTVIAAGLGDALANDRDLKRLAPRIAYLTGKRPANTGLLSIFRVIDVMTTNVRRIGKKLKKMGVGRIEVKHRGVELVTAEQVKRLKLSGTEKMTVILTRLTTQRIAILAKRKKVRRDSD
ncbi:MAG: class I SAM-dependent methyltransferase [Planctomycetota bacterium]